ncbi:hypothetical protein GGU11DRAFT_759540 [Lentinula aff. detonsa]|nr:hypothetical protein GGU11DRAFT_759540 [Lentinula aff. detonsa]
MSKRQLRARVQSEATDTPPSQSEEVATNEPTSRIPRRVRGTNLVRSNSSPLPELTPELESLADPLPSDGMDTTSSGGRVDHDPGRIMENPTGYAPEGPTEARLPDVLTEDVGESHSIPQLGEPSNGLRDRVPIVEDEDESKCGSPIMTKGKAVDARNWGALDLSDTEIDADVQQHILDSIRPMRSDITPPRNVERKRNVVELDEHEMLEFLAWRKNSPKSRSQTQSLHIDRVSVLPKMPSTEERRLRDITMANPDRTHFSELKVGGATDRMAESNHVRKLLDYLRDREDEPSSSDPGDSDDSLEATKNRKKKHRKMRIKPIEPAKYNGERDEQKFHRFAKANPETSSLLEVVNWAERIELIEDLDKKSSYSARFVGDNTSRYGSGPSSAKSNFNHSKLGQKKDFSGAKPNPSGSKAPVPTSVNPKNGGWNKDHLESNRTDSESGHDNGQLAADLTDDITIDGHEAINAFNIRGWHNAIDEIRHSPGFNSLAHSELPRRKRRVSNLLDPVSMRAADLLHQGVPYPGETLGDPEIINPERFIVFRILLQNGVSGFVIMDTAYEDREYALPMATLEDPDFRIVHWYAKQTNGDLVIPEVNRWENVRPMGDVFKIHIKLSLLVKQNLPGDSLPVQIPSGRRTNRFNAYRAADDQSYIIKDRWLGFTFSVDLTLLPIRANVPERFLIPHVGG